MTATRLVLPRNPGQGRAGDLPSRLMDVAGEDDAGSEHAGDGEDLELPAEDGTAGHDDDGGQDVANHRERSSQDPVAEVRRSRVGDVGGGRAGSGRGGTSGHDGPFLPKAYATRCASHERTKALKLG